ncbi:LEA type 2 family protein [Paraburkholderia sp. GAS42]|uniref:LEA type 2 family protein n=1 Tax=Paraburkholderia sp. GAS42 TaxID=3035135 RepID=UPI003D226408
MPSFRALNSARLFLVAALCVSVLSVLSGCSSLPGHEDIRVSVAGIEPIESQGLELRFNVKLRLQNPNDYAANFDGVSLDLEVNGQPFASGVSDQSGAVPRFGETLVSVPVTIPGFSAARQAIAFANGTWTGDLPYELHGRLAGGVFGGIRFTDHGVLPLPGFSTFAQ